MLFILSLIIAAWGIALIGLGRRGRKLDDHPICGGCGFDLVGSLPPGRRSAFAVPKGARCPECGVALARAGAIEIGNRARRPGAIRAGVVVTVVGVLGMVTILYLGATRGAIARVQPTWMLIPQASRDREALLELVGRVAAGTCDERQTKDLVARALQSQADLSREWDAAWGDLIEEARLRKQVSDADWARYLKSGYGPARLRVVTTDSWRPYRVEARLEGILRFGGSRVSGVVVMGRPGDLSVEGGRIEFPMNASPTAWLLAGTKPWPGWEPMPNNPYTFSGSQERQIARGEVLFDAPRMRIRGRWQVRAVNADGSTAAEWELPFESDLARPE
ncbi:MAG: hypothetical protein IT436_18100 [Phycisphaerales bacterium]|nr:hypothetical protein [Phycisphaerales bacterium]